MFTDHQTAFTLKKRKAERSHPCRRHTDTTITKFFVHDIFSSCSVFATFPQYHTVGIKFFRHSLGTKRAVLYRSMLYVTRAKTIV